MTLEEAAGIVYPAEALARSRAARIAANAGAPIAPEYVGPRAIHPMLGDLTFERDTRMWWSDYCIGGDDYANARQDARRADPALFAEHVRECLERRA